jgi:hypothetical protein
LKENSKKISRCVESNGVKTFQIIVHLVIFAGIRSSTQNEKEKNTADPLRPKRLTSETDQLTALTIQLTGGTDRYQTG